MGSGMGVLVLILWIVSLVLFGIQAFYPNRSILAAALFAFDLWIGLHFLMEVTDPITF